jgi:hypothetical protein
MVQIRTLAFGAARIAAVALALVTLFVFVVQAQRAAEKKPVALQPVVTPTVAPPGASALEVGAAERQPELSIQPVAPFGGDHEIFLPTSKSLRLSPRIVAPVSTAESDPTYKDFSIDPTSPVFLPSSKVRMMSDGVREILQPGSFSTAAKSPKP